MTKDTMLERKEQGGQHFWEYVRPLLEKKLRIEVLPLELLPDNKVTEAFDKAGIDAFYLERGYLRGLGSRMRYSSFGGCSFTLRHRPNREYEQRLKVISNPSEYFFFPHLHVESFLDKKLKAITWSYAARMQDIIHYVEANFDNENKVSIKCPASDNNRQVIIVPIALFRKEYPVEELKNTA